MFYCHTRPAFDVVDLSGSTASPRLLSLKGLRSRANRFIPWDLSLLALVIRLAMRDFNSLPVSLDLPSVAVTRSHPSIFTSSHGHLRPTIHERQERPNTRLFAPRYPARRHRSTEPPKLENCGGTLPYATYSTLLMVCTGSSDLGRLCCDE